MHKLLPYNTLLKNALNVDVEANVNVNVKRVNFFPSKIQKSKQICHLIWGQLREIVLIHHTSYSEKD